VAFESVLVVSCSGSLERSAGLSESGVEALCSASCKRGAGLRKLSISCYTLEFRGARVVELIIVFRVSGRRLSAALLLRPRSSSWTLALKALKSSLSNSIIRSSILY
jgi:hypothetical protein